MLETRVETLEREVKDIRTTLQRFEILLVEIRANLINVATKDDIRPLSVETADIRARMATRSELDDVRKDTAKIREELAENKGRIVGIDGRLTTIDSKFAYIPTVWGQLGIFSTLLFGMAAVFFALERLLHP